jgi:EAL domain-containing protein (putative c-di-GMP-specific phosphodiesterase class I)
VLKNIVLFLNSIFPKNYLYRLQDSSLSYIFPKKSNNIDDILEILKQKLSQYKVVVNSIEMEFSFKVLAVSGKEDVLNKYNLVNTFIKDKGIKQIYQYFDDKIYKIKEEQKNLLFWVNKTLEAVNNSNIEPFFQAIVDNKTQKIVKYEVLARLRDANKYVSPYFFIGPAKEAGILVPITQMIIEKSFKKIANTDISISINITSYDLEENYLEEFLEEKLKENNLTANQITIEILEGIESEDNNKHLTQLLRLKEKGFVIAIDDFGTGYSNFQRVHRIHPDFIKIDGIYIKDITKNENSLKITKAIIKFAKSIDAKIIAEFVADEEIYKKVTELGVEYSQGYYFAEPSLEIKEKV